MINSSDAQRIVEAGRYVFASKEDIRSLRSEMNEKFDRLFGMLSGFDDLRRSLNNLSTKEDINKLVEGLGKEGKEENKSFASPF